MPLSGYGFLVGDVSSLRGAIEPSEHLLLFVQPMDQSHPPYRVALNLTGTTKNRALAAIVDFSGTPDFIAQIRTFQGTANAFERDDGSPDFPRIDYTANAYPTSTQFALVDGGLGGKIQGSLAVGTRVIVFGTGAPINQRGGSVPATGFSGVENVHLNQGSRCQTGGTDHYLENGATQDGAIFVLRDNGTTRGIFIKFESQSLDNNALGHPRDTGMPAFDAAIKRAAPSIQAHQATLNANLVGATPPAAYVFADPDPEHGDETFLVEDDSATRNNPIATAMAQGKQLGIVPTPRIYPPILELESIVGPLGAVQSICFDVIGDSGATKVTSDAHEKSVTGMMTDDAATEPPAFLFHVGDVVYFYGEQNFYYSQFYEPFQAYPAPIFAIPGNHDGITYNSSMVSLQAFQEAFCAETPSHWQGSGGILRTSMTQPGVYFTLDAPLVSIIGLYSNCGESFGVLTKEQYGFFTAELTRLKTLQANDGRAVVLAIHHCPKWWITGKKDPTSVALDTACQQVGMWPDAVIAGHVHLYQRFVRTIAGREIPYLLAGAGGYTISPAQLCGKNANLDREKHVFEFGYMKLSVRGRSMTFTYRDVKTKGVSDTVTLDLDAHTVNAGA